MSKRVTKTPRRKKALSPLERVPLRTLVSSVKHDLRRRLRAASETKRRRD